MLTSVHRAQCSEKQQLEILLLLRHYGVEM